MSQLRLDDHDKAKIVELYGRTNKTVDRLPYTRQFEQLYEEYQATAERRLTRNQFWRALSSRRKARQLVRKER